jgi:hypothetical protein
MVEQKIDMTRTADREIINKSVYIEVTRPERLVYDHVSGPTFRATVTFEELGGETRLSM